MLRKLVIGLVTVASLSSVALTEASAKSLGGRGFSGGHGVGGHHFAGGHGFGGRHFGGGFGVGVGLGLIEAAVVASSCRTVVTANGRVINAC